MPITHPFSLPQIVHILSRVIGTLADALPDVANLLLAVLGVLMSFPDKAAAIEKNKVLSKVIGYTCVAVAVAGLGGSAYQRRHFNSQIGQLISDDDKLVVDTGRLVTSTNTMVTGFGILAPKLSALDEHVADVERKLAAAREKHDPKLIADLQSQVTTARAQAENLSKTMLLSLAPGILGELQGWARKWEEDDISLSSRTIYERQHPDSPGQPERLDEANNAMARMNADHTRQIWSLMASANYLREQLLRGQLLTAEDQRYAVLVGKVLAHTPINWTEMRDISSYMGSLVTKAGTPATPSALGATVK
jgi:hypothetical protein